MTGYRDAVVKLVWQLVRLRGDEANSPTTDASLEVRAGVEIALAAFIGKEACNRIVALIRQNYRDLAALEAVRAERAELLERFGELERAARRAAFVFEEIDAVLAELELPALQFGWLPDPGLRDHFPVGLEVKDRNDLVGVVVGYAGGKVVVETAIVEAGQEPILRQTPISPQEITPVYPRPSKHELLCSIKRAIQRAADKGDGASVLALAQARALLL